MERSQRQTIGFPTFMIVTFAVSVVSSPLAKPGLWQYASVAADIGASLGTALVLSLPALVAAGIAVGFTRETTPTASKFLAPSVVFGFTFGLVNVGGEVQRRQVEFLTLSAVATPLLLVTLCATESIRSRLHRRT